MANKIILKKTSTASKVPLSTDLEVGEIAVNLADQKLYSKNASGTVIVVGQGIGGAGDVVGPSSSTDNSLARYDGTTGKLIQNSLTTVDDNGVLATAKELIGDSASANFTRFPNALAVVSNTTSGIQQNESLNIGLISESVSSNTTWASGVYGVGYTNTVGDGRGTGVTGEGHVSSATDTGVCVGVRGYAKDVHTGNYNIGLYGDAENGDIGLTYGGNVSLFLANGNIVTSSASAKTWYLGGNITYNGQGSAKTIGVTNGAVFALGTPSSGTLSNCTGLPNAGLVNSAITINGTSVSLGGSYSNPLATSTTAGLIELGSDTVQTVAPNAVTATASRSYALQVNASGQAVVNVPWTDTNSGGTVTSVSATVPTGLSISGSPITTSGTLAIGLQSGYSIPTTASQTNWDSAFTQRLQWDGGSTNLVASTGRTSLGATTVGGNLFTLTNPSAITFPRFNADNTVSALDASTFRTAIGAGTGSGTVTSVGGTGSVNGITLSGTVTSSGNLTLGGTLSGVSLNTQVTGTLPIANGGTGATTNSGARTNLGATTVGSNFFTLTNPSAVTFPRMNADNTISSLSATDFRTAIGAGTGNGTVTSITAGTGLTGGTITTSGTVALANTAVTAGSYTNANITVDAQGRLTSASNGTGGGVSSIVAGTGIAVSSSTGNVTVSLANIAPAFIYDTFTATASQTTFTTSTTYTSGKIAVYRNGAKQRNGGDVTVTSGNTVVFASPCVAGDVIDINYPVVAQAGTMIYQNLTATAGQTSFSTSNTYTANKIEVFKNGAKQRNGSDVTVTSGNSVVFAVACTAGDLVDLVYPI